MNNLKTWCTVVTAVFLAAGVRAGHAAGDAQAGKTMIAFCKACHGADGNSPSNPMWERYTTQDYQNMAKEPQKYRMNPVWPKLAGQNEVYMANQMRNFKSGIRTDHNMWWNFTTDLSAKDIENIAAYYAAQKPKSEAVADSQAAKAGEELFKKGKPGMKPCMKCHGASGRGNEKVARIAGQHIAYIQKQIWAFKLEVRKTTKEMPPIAEKLSEAEIKAVAEYIAGLQ